MLAMITSKVINGLVQVFKGGKRRFSYGRIFGEEKLHSRER